MYQAERVLVQQFLQRGILKGSSKVEVKVGFPKPPLQDKAKDRIGWLYEAALNVCSRKVDIVIENEQEIWLLEAKLRLSPGAVGQILTYAELYRQTFPLRNKKLRLGILCWTDDPGVRQVAEAQGITIFVLDRANT